MTNQIKTRAAANDVAPRHCGTWLAIFQLVLGSLLVTAAASVYSLMQHPAVLIPSFMGATLLFLGARALLVCRNRPLFGKHHHPSAG